MSATRVRLIHKSSKYSNEMRMEWHMCSSSVDKNKPRARSSFFAGRLLSGGANSCIWVWQIAAREPLMTRTNDRGASRMARIRRRKWEMVWKNKGRSVERTRRTVRYGRSWLLDETDTKKKPVHSRLLAEVKMGQNWESRLIDKKIN